MRPTVSKSWLVLAYLATLACGFFSSFQVMGRYRYAEWSAIDREMLDSFLFCFPLTSLLATFISLKFLDETLPWNSPHLPRARLSQLLDMLSCSGAAVLGLITGWTPILVWGFRTSTQGHPSLLNFIAVAIWLIATTLMSAALSSTFRTFWPGLAFAVIWIAIFELGRMKSASANSAELTTRFAAFGVDGAYAMTTAPLTQNPALLLMRIVGGTLTALVGAYALTRTPGVPSLFDRMRKSFATFPALACVAFFAISALFPVAITVHNNARSSCSTASTIEVCTYTSHSKDLGRLESIARRLKTNAPSLLANNSITEGGSGSGIQVNLSPEKNSSSDKEIAEQIAQGLYDPHACYRSGSQTDFTIPTLVGSWIVSQALGSGAVDSVPQSQKSRYESWKKNVVRTNSALTGSWPKIQNCRAKLSDLPE